MDEAQKRGFEIDLAKFSQELGAVVIPTSASTGAGLEDLKNLLKSKMDQEVIPPIVLPQNYQKVFRSPSYVNGIFKKIDSLLKNVTILPLKPDTFSERVDHLVLHPVWGIIILFSLLILMFQTLFTWAAPLQDMLESAFAFLSEIVSTYIENDLLKSLLADGIISGVGGVLVFLPQIMILFLFIQFLEDLGYLAGQLS